MTWLKDSNTKCGGTELSAPKTIYVHKSICNVVENGEDSSTARIDRRWSEDIEYRLVDPGKVSEIGLTGNYHADCNELMSELANARSKIERIRNEIKIMRDSYSNLSLEAILNGPMEMSDRYHHIASGIGLVIKIIDRISNENDVPVIGGEICTDN